MNKINVYGWKGKDKIKIKEDGKYYQIIEHRQVKKTGNIEKGIHYVPKENVSNLFSILASIDTDDCYRYGEIVPKLIKWYELKCDRDSFNGGNNRGQYFMLYYYPVKILEAKGIIEYGGRGTIKLIN